MTKEASNAVEGAQASVDPSDPYLREEQTFPVLSEQQVDRISRYGETADYDKGTVLFERGDRGVDFFLVLKGNVEIYDFDPQGQPLVITTHGVRQFTGELDLFNHRKILVGGRTGEASTLVRLTRAQFERMSSTEQDIGEIIMRAFILRRTGLILHAEAGVVLIGQSTDRDLIRLNRFLNRNGYPCEVVAPDDAEALQYVSSEDLKIQNLPIVRTPNGQVFNNPSTADLADQLGLTEEIDPEHVFDLAVVGAGPAGLSTCVYAASENLDTVVIEAEAPGGQAGTSSKIENYLGFPTGISGPALAGRAWIQGQKFGAKFAIARAANEIEQNGAIFQLTTEGERKIRARTVVLACGATYRRLQLENYQKFEGQGIHYAATALEAKFCNGSEIVVIGGGNSAGQAAIFLSGYAKHVHILIRREGLEATMSDYLVRRIHQSTKISLHPNSELSSLQGDRVLETVSWTNNQTNAVTEKPITNVFVMIGAVPNTAWLGDCVELDNRGFIVTGSNVQQGTSAPPFQSSIPGIYAVGDVRSGSIKRVASGVGEGSVCVSGIHAYLAENA
ncbi:MAG: FAD-dependent oxidoreductase [Pseudomonadota bacterium]